MILMDNIIKEGHPTLSKKAKDVTLPLSITDKKLLKEMLEFVRNSQDEELATTYELRPAVGIAAPQLNVSKRLFVVSLFDFNNVLYEYMLINPTMEIINEEIIYLPDGEGCLSVDRPTEGLTPRYKEVLIKAYRFDEASNLVIPIELKLRGYVGIVFQHEFDHLEGVMFTEKLYPKLNDALPAFEIIDDKLIEV